MHAKRTSPCLYLSLPPFGFVCTCMHCCCIFYLFYRLNTDLGSFVYPSLLLEKQPEAQQQPEGSSQDLPGGECLCACVTCAARENALPVLHVVSPTLLQHKDNQLCSFVPVRRTGPLISNIFIRNPIQPQILMYTVRNPV